MDGKVKHFMVSVILLCVIFGIILVIGLRMETEQHEQAHGQICKYVGGVPNITYTNFETSGTTNCTGENNTILCLSTEDYRMKVMLDSMNESVEYQILPLFFLIASFALVICIFQLTLLELEFNRG